MIIFKVSLARRDALGCFQAAVLDTLRLPTITTLIHHFKPSGQGRLTLAEKHPSTKNLRFSAKSAEKGGSWVKKGPESGSNL